MFSKDFISQMTFSLAQMRTQSEFDLRGGKLFSYGRMKIRRITKKETSLQVNIVFF